mgnify:CR=1 FL=1
MKQEKTRLVVDGNAFYEIDLECMRKKEKKQREQQDKHRKGQRK